MRLLRTQAPLAALIGLRSSPDLPLIALFAPVARALRRIRAGRRRLGAASARMPGSAPTISAATC